jgi:integrase
MTRRANYEGSIYRRSDGRWAAALMLDGRRKWVYGKTRQEVADRLRELQQQASRQGMLADPGRRTVADLLDAWLEAVAPILKPRSLDSYRQICDAHIRPTIGKVRLSRLTPDVIQRLITPLQQQGKARTAAKVYATLRRACRVAVLWGWLASNPCERVLRPQYQAERREVWTHDDLRRFPEGAQGHPLYPLYLLLVTTGLRLGEALALRWSDVDWVAGTVQVERSVQRIRGEWVFSSPKSKSSIRSVTLPAEVLATLKQHRLHQIKELGSGWSPEGLVFCNRQGGVLCQSVVQHTLQRLCERLELPSLTPHGLRHLHASLLLSEGLPIPLVSRRLGHANAAVTMGIYAHCVSKRDDQAVQAISRALTGG